jgi:hypothetical protein
MGPKPIQAGAFDCFRRIEARHSWTGPLQAELVVAGQMSVAGRCQQGHLHNPDSGAVRAGVEGGRRRRVVAVWRQMRDDQRAFVRGHLKDHQDFEPEN